MIDRRRAEAREGRREEGRCLFKTRTQHHRMVGKNRPRGSSSASVGSAPACSSTCLLYTSPSPRDRSLS
eukprot:6353698-Pyramimonas_sp.AAC.1